MDAGAFTGLAHIASIDNLPKLRIGLIDLFLWSSVGVSKLVTEVGERTLRSVRFDDTGVSDAVVRNERLACQLAKIRKAASILEFIPESEMLGDRHYIGDLPITLEHSDCAPD